MLNFCGEGGNEPLLQYVGYQMVDLPVSDDAMN
jgi:hypothetical protein